MSANFIRLSCVMFEFPNWFDANNWHCQYLASQHLAKSKFAKCWQLVVRLRRKVGSQPITSQHLAFAKYCHANFWHQTNHALNLIFHKFFQFSFAIQILTTTIITPTKITLISSQNRPKNNIQYILSSVK